MIFAGIPLGLTLGAAAWAIAGGPQRADQAMARVAADTPVVGRAVQLPVKTGGLLARLETAPALFVLLSGPGAVSDPVIRLDGIAKSANRSAALISINGGPAVWLSVGEARDGVTLEAVGVSAITLDLPSGAKELRLGDGANIATNAQGQIPGALAMPPPSDFGSTSGFRQPLPPASAPGMGGG